MKTESYAFIRSCDAQAFQGYPSNWRHGCLVCKDVGGYYPLPDYLKHFKKAAKFLSEHRDFNDSDGGMLFHYDYIIDLLWD
jgi:hypothetical protein